MTAYTIRTRPDRRQRKRYLAPARAACLLLLASIGLPDASAAGPSELELRRTGIPVFREHFKSEDYRAAPQNFWITQDTRGIIYVANPVGVLEYDGNRWRTIPTPAAVLSLAVDADGTVYVGSNDDIGYLRPGSRGDLVYASLRSQLPPELSDLGRFWNAHAVDDGVYFQSREHILRWDGSKFKTWTAAGVYHMAFAVRNRYFVREQGVGLQEMVGDSLALISGGDLFADDQVFMMTELGGSLVLGSRQTGFYRVDEDGPVALVTEADPYLQEHQLVQGSAMRGGHLALATLSGGVVVLGPDLRVVDVLNPTRGLPDARVNNVFEDSQGGLWLAFNSQGIMRTDPVSPVSLIDERLGLHGVVYHLNRHGNAMLASTGAGLYAIDLDRRTAERVMHPDLGAQIAEVWATVNYRDMLLLASSKGLWALRDAGDAEHVMDYPTYAVISSGIFPDVLYAGTKSGVMLIRRRADGWIVDDRVPRIGGEVRHLVEEADGTLWFRSQSHTLYRMRTLPAGPVEVQSFTPADGIPPGGYGIARIHGTLAIAHTTGVYRYRGDGFGPAFVRDPTLDSPWLQNSDELHALTEDNTGTVWMVYQERTDVARPGAEGYVFSSPDALRLGDQGTREVDVFVEDSGIAWLAYGDNVLRYDPNHRGTYEHHFRALIRRVSPIGERWNIFGGAFASAEGRIRLDQEASLAPRLVYDYNHLRFEVAAPSYNDVTRNEFQYLLENYDEDWSRWTASPVAEYTNLPEGRYRFRVRARNGQGYLSSEASYSLTVLPPWYRTWWAYLIYVAACVAVVVTAVSYRRMWLDNRRAREQARELALERVVNERLTQVNDRLRQADLLKDQLLSNTSHELRTPITAILGFTSVLKDESPQHLQEFLDIIEENGHRLMRTVTSMVDFARLQAGVIEVHREAVEISREVEQVVSRLAHMARKKHLYFELRQPGDLVHAWVDRKCIERIVENVLSNAIKFTEEGGVTIRISSDDDTVYVRVADTGIGMDSEFMPDLFKAFKQESMGLARTHEGSGLGLAITARLVELMDGEIEVSTSKGAGTTVTVSFPVFYVAQPEERSDAKVTRRSSA